MTDKLFSEEGSDTPAQLNPFFLVVLEQFLTYIAEHADEIVQALLDLLGDSEQDEEQQEVFASLRSTPNKETLACAVAKVKAAGVSDKKIAQALLNEVTFH